MPTIVDLCITGGAVKPYVFVVGQEKTKKSMLLEHEDLECVCAEGSGHTHCRNRI